MTIAANIQSTRRTRGVSEAGLATVLGVDVSYIHLLENGHVKPSGCMATRLADALLVQREGFVDFAEALDMKSYRKDGLL